MNTKKLLYLLIPIFTSCINAESFVSVAEKDLIQQLKNTEYSAISRLSVNRYTKGVKYNYYFHKEIAENMNGVNPFGILFYDADVNSSKSDANITF